MDIRGPTEGPSRKESKKEEAMLPNLPDEVWLMIFQNVDDPKTLRTLAQVSSAFEGLTLDSSVQMRQKITNKAIAILLSPSSPEVEKSAKAYLKKVIPKGVKKLNLRGKRVSDEEIDLIVKNFPQIEELNLSKTELTTLQLAKLKDLVNLTTLNVSDNPITNGGLEHLKGLKSLQTLNLWGCSKITDGDLEHLKNLKALQMFILGRCDKITDDGLKHLKGLNALQRLNLGSCDKITDDGLKHLKGLDSLQTLILGKCDKITDKGLDHLKGLNTLRRLSLLGCSKITDDGFEHLKENCPNLKVIR